MVQTWWTKSENIIQIPSKLQQHPACFLCFWGIWRRSAFFARDCQIPRCHDMIPFLTGGKQQKECNGGGRIKGFREGNFCHGSFPVNNEFLKPWQFREQFACKFPNLGIEQTTGLMEGVSSLQYTWYLGCSVTIGDLSKGTKTISWYLTTDSTTLQPIPALQ